MTRWLLAGLLLLLPVSARAGAWTQEKGRWQVITSLVLSQADRSFGSSVPVDFRRVLVTSYTEYGLRPDVTLFAATESAYVDVRQGSTPRFHDTDNAVEGGARVRVGRWLGLEELGVLSLEASLRTAGAFNFAISANRNAGGSGGGLRLLYGRSFTLGGRNGFLDVEAGRRFQSGARPDETPLDLTTGLWLNQDNMVMLQSFNLFAGAGSVAAYPAFRSHKLQLSWVRRMSRHFLLQTGGFVSPAGHNALVEQGVSLSLWTRF